MVLRTLCASMPQPHPHPWMRLQRIPTWMTRDPLKDRICKDPSSLARFGIAESMGLNLGWFEPLREEASWAIAFCFVQRYGCRLLEMHKNVVFQQERYYTIILVFWCLLSVLHFVCWSRAGGSGHAPGNCMGSLSFLNSWKFASRIMHLLPYCRKLPRARDAWAYSSSCSTSRKRTTTGKNQQRMGRKRRDETMKPETAVSLPRCRISTNITNLVWAWNRVKQVKGSIRQILLQEQLGEILPPVSTWASKTKTILSSHSIVAIV